MSKDSSGRKSQTRLNARLGQLLKNSVEETGLFQSDILALIGAIPHLDNPTNWHRMLWAVQRPNESGQSASGSIDRDRDPAALSSPIQEEILVLLSEAIDQELANYGPDDDVPPERTAVLLTSSIAKGLRLRALGQAGDEQRSSVDTAISVGIRAVSSHRRNTARILQKMRNFDDPDIESIFDNPPSFFFRDEIERSTVVATGVALCERAEWLYADRDRDAAFANWSAGFRLFVECAEQADELSEFTPAFAVPIPQFDAQKVIDTFESAKILPQRNWKLLMELIDPFISIGDLPLNETTDAAFGEQFITVDGIKSSWSHYWGSEKYFVAGRMTPDERREELLAADDRAAEERVRGYFLSEDEWEWLNERAKGYLINADNFFFTTRKGRPEQLLSALKIAIVDEAFRVGIWEPLARLSDGDSALATRIGLRTADVRSLQEFFRDAERARDNFASAKYVTLAQHVVFDLIFNRLLPSDVDDKTSGSISSAMRILVSERNSAEHDHDEEVEWTRETLRDFYKKMIGVGREGLLQRIVKIGMRLNPSPGPSTSG